TGLRGYPLRYQAGKANALLTLEERFYSSWQPLKLFNVGAALFVDAGRSWGQDEHATAPAGWLEDVGVGLRLGSARSGLGNVLHIDLAMPLNRTSDIDSLQFLIETRKSFCPILARISFWRQLRAPLLLFASIAPLLAASSLDLSIAHALFYDEGSLQWIGTGSWWTNELVHRGGSWLIRAIGAFAILIWVASWLRPPLQRLRRPALFFIMSLTLSIGLVAFMKAVTNVDCPRDLTEFGGAFPFIHLFEHRPAFLRQAHCFPAAHASSGYALLALYFLLRERSRRAARMGLAIGLGVGLVF